MRKASNEIFETNRAIERYLDNASLAARGPLAQDIVGKLRHLVEPIAVLLVNGDLVEERFDKAASDAMLALKKKRDTRFIADFHGLLQKVVSHYTPSEQSSERLMLKYCEYLSNLKDYVFNHLGIEILRNLDKFPLDQDPGLSPYYRQIVSKIDSFMLAGMPTPFSERYYVHSCKPFFVDGHVYYESALILAQDKSSKFDHVVAFSSQRLPDNYAVLLSTKSTHVNALGLNMPIIIVDKWQVSIRPCEINKLLKILGSNLVATSQLKSYQSLMKSLTCTGMSLVEIATLPSHEYSQFMIRIDPSGQNRSIETLLKKSREFLLGGGVGCNVLRYLLYKPRNRVLLDQVSDFSNTHLGGLYLMNSCKPFDRHPYCTALRNHLVSVHDLFNCIDPDAHKDNHLARYLTNNAQQNGVLYTPEESAEKFTDIDDQIQRYNSSLWFGHTSGASDRRIARESSQLFIRGYENSVVSTIESLIRLSNSGIAGYASSCSAWLGSHPSMKYDEKKKDALSAMFSQSRVALVCGSAGTGKTTMVDLLCSALPNVKKIAIANTNPAVESLRRKISDPCCKFQTITKYLGNAEECKVLIIDECSTVSNRDICSILAKGKYSILLLVGDVKQIEAISLGNWFELAMAFLPKRCIFEFTKPWRASNNDLVKLWDSVRDFGNDITEILEATGISTDFDNKLLERNSEDEIVLCLNYDGLYGINGINRILQMSNPNKAFQWGLHRYKIGDPVLFNESKRFYPLLYNNLKGQIVDIEFAEDGTIVFEVEVDAILNELSVDGCPGLSFVRCSGNSSVVRFSVRRGVDPDEDDQDEECVVPFQVAYAISIHKAQGLEYDSVKIVVTKDVEKRITHSIFYTAITRARKSLTIFWSPETQKTVIEQLAPSNCNRDACLIAQRFGLKLHPEN